MNDQQEHELVANWMEPVPTFVLNKTVSEKGWWRSNCKINDVASTNDAHLFPAKDPRTDIAAAMEVYCRITNEEYPKHKITATIVSGYAVHTVYIKDKDSGKTIAYEGSKDLRKAIFDAVVKLIEYLKEKEK